MMSNCRNKFLSDSFFHIYNRGFNKERIFFDSSDYERFLSKIFFYQKRYEKYLVVNEVCLLPNHFHFLIYNLKRNLQIANFMRDLQLSHSKYIKMKYRLIYITLFEFRYKSKFIKDEKQLETVVFYIRNNPVKHEYVENMNEWNWCFHSSSDYYL